MGAASHLLIVMAALIGLSCRPATAHDLCGSDHANPADKLGELMTNGRATELSRDGRYVAFEDRNQIIWTFTQPQHPAHPAMVCRRIVTVDGELKLITEADCHASRAACDDLMREFADLNARMIEAMKAATKPKQ